jgi:hypothetical protein
VTKDTGVIPKKPRKRFRAEWVKFPRAWMTALGRSKSASTYQLALVILFGALKRKYGNSKHSGDAIVLSSATTGMPHETRRRAAYELVELGLIEIEQDGNQAIRVSKVYCLPRQW